MKNGIIVLLAVAIMSTAAAVIFAPVETLQLVLDQIIRPACLFAGKVFEAVVLIGIVALAWLFFIR